MNPSERFFAKLRKLTVCLETESNNLLHASQNLKEDDEDEENGAQALYQLHSEVRQLKRQVQDQVATHDGATTELRTFIRRCLVLKQRTTEDIDRLKKHYEKYGYRPRKTVQENTVVESTKEEEEQGEREQEHTDTLQEEEKMGQDAQRSETPEKIPPPSDDHLRTPKLSDFGLSALHFQRVFSEAKLPPDVSPAPAVALSPPPFVMNMQPPQPKTPKCSLSMDEDAPTPQLEDFGISEYTMCWNNDFTMDLFNKKPPQKSSKTTENAHKPPHGLSSVSNRGLIYESMESPDTPVFCTPGLKIEKPRITSSLQVDGQINFESPPRLNNGPSTPEPPAFETPFISKLLKKEARQERHEQHRGFQGSSFNIPEPSIENGSSLCEAPEMPEISSYEEEVMPEMPTLQSNFGNSLAFKNTPGDCLSEIQMDLKESPVLVPEDGLNQNWGFATPKVRMGFPVDPCTPEMPDMSSVTQDILKLVAQCKF